jgi:hypothetical protein
MDVATIAGELYVLAAGSIDPAMPNGIYRILDDGSLEQVIDLATWSADNPPAFTPPDYNAEGSWFDLESDGEKFWVSEAVGGRIVTVTREGAITLVADLSEGHMVPTGLALDGKGGAYVTYETTVPYAEGSSKVTHVAADGTTTDVWTGLTAVTDLVMGPDGVLYAAEMASQTTESAPYLAPGTGRVVRQTGPDSLEAVATDVPYPVDLGFDADGMLYVSGPAFGQGKAEGEGWLARIDPAQSPVSFAGIGDAPATCSTG